MVVRLGFELSCFPAVEENNKILKRTNGIEKSGSSPCISVLYKNLNLKGKVNVQISFVNVDLLHVNLIEILRNIFLTCSFSQPPLPALVLTTCCKSDTHLFFSAMYKKERLHSGLKHQYSVTVRRPAQLRQTLS